MPTKPVREPRAVTSRQRETREKQITEAMGGLVNHPQFGAFIDLLLQQRETVIEDICLDATLSNPQALYAAVGELRTYKSMVSIYDDHVARIAMERDKQSEQSTD